MALKLRSRRNGSGNLPGLAVGAADLELVQEASCRVEELLVGDDVAEAVNFGYA